jgi:hypothetical protein
MFFFHCLVLRPQPAHNGRNSLPRGRRLPRLFGRPFAATASERTDMADKLETRRKAENHFTASEQRDAFVKSELAKESAAFDARTAKLRALRLAKEAADKIEQDRLDALNPPKAKTAKKKKAAAR